MLLRISLYVIILSFLSGNFKNCRQITFTGIAQNDKHNATVLTEDGRYYFLDGLEKWDEKHWHKKVTVTGKLIVIERKPNTDTFITITPQGPALRRIIKHPRWNLVE